MKSASQYTIGIILLICIVIRVVSIDFERIDQYKITTHDGLGYYLYLPGIFIYQDITNYKWLEEIDEKYNVVGEEWRYQLSKHENGNYVANYLGGVALLQLPFFTMAHVIALMSSYPADGFSPPYQVLLSFAPLFYFVLILFLLRSVLLRYYSDKVTAWTLCLLFIASNAVLYVSIEAEQCHGYILLLYAIMLWLSIQWHSAPSHKWAFYIGLTTGLATIMRPTELLIVLIPLIWDKGDLRKNGSFRAFVLKYKSHIGWATMGALLGAVPQIIYWLYTTGSPLHTIGSKWYFLNPYFRVLFGWQKGWFIYTPITIFFILGLFFIRNKPFKKAVIWFSILNIWVVIAWSVWRYGGSYSTRALVQSYPVFALSLAGFISWIEPKKYKFIFYLLAIYLTAVNLFQVWQYRKGILRHDEMNRTYYQSVYLKSQPTALDMSLLDGGGKIPYRCKERTILSNRLTETSVKANQVFYKQALPVKEWVDIQLEMQTLSGFWNGCIAVVFEDSDKKELKRRTFRMFNHLTKPDKENEYHMQLDIPEEAAVLKLQLGGGENVTATINDIHVSICTSK